MSKKIIKLTESDLEKIVKRVLQENELEEQGTLRAKMAGNAARRKANIANREEENALKAANNQKEFNIKKQAQLQQLSTALLSDIKKMEKSIGRLFPIDKRDDIDSSIITTLNDVEKSLVDIKSTLNKSVANDQNQTASGNSTTEG